MPCRKPHPGLKLKRICNAQAFDWHDRRAVIATYWPFGLRLDLPDTPMTLATATGDFFVRAKSGEIRADLRPGIPPKLHQFSARSGAWQINTRFGNLASADTMDLRITQDIAQRDDTYVIALNSDNVTPGDVTRQTIGLPPSWPRSFDSFVALMSVGLNPSAPPVTSDGQRAVMQKLTIDNMSATWGPLGLEATGSLTVNDAGIPDGNLTARIKNWRQAYEIMKDNGIVKAEREFQTDILLNGLANIGGDPETLDFVIRFQEGQMYFGPVLLGPAPKILF